MPFFLRQRKVLETLLKITLLFYSSPSERVSDYISLITTEIIRVRARWSTRFFPVCFSARQSTERNTALFQSSNVIKTAQ